MAFVVGSRASFLWSALLLATTSISVTQADVGYTSPHGYAIDQDDLLGPGLWAMTPEGCRVGSPGNLVVSPLGGTNSEGGELLDTLHIGPQLCAWLSMIEKAHYSVKESWEAERQRRRSQTPFWNIFKRFSLWRSTFPEPEFVVRIVYLDLWNKDRFGFNMPWITAYFSYQCPESGKTYGLLDHLCGSVFSIGNDPRAPSPVQLLLQPRPGYNRPLAVGASGWQYVAGFLAGLGRGSDEPRSDVAVTWDWAAAVYGHMASFITLRGHIDEYWMNAGRCYFRSLLHLEWRVFSRTVCEELHREAASGVVGAFKAARVNSVRLNITGLDFFRGHRPVMWGLLDEGVLGINLSSALLRMEIDTSPSNVPDYERSRSTAQNVRAAGLVLKGIKWFFSDPKED
ncbi:hypothetical protein Emag_001081 [Eimeria magna]